ncbi:MAG: BON domain-containing protein [Burkholderiaceae bacterium]
MNRRSLAAVLAAGAVVVSLPACAPLIVGGAAAGTAMMATDRRSAGAIVEDQTLETRVAYELDQRLNAESVHISNTVFNGKVLLTGEVPTEALKVQAGRIAHGVLNVKSVANEIAVMPASSLGSRTNDLVILGKIKAAFIDSGEVSTSSVKIVVERGIVYLMGIVTEREADAAGKAAARVSGVSSVVKLFDVESPAEIRRRMGQP